MAKSKHNLLVFLRFRAMKGGRRVVIVFDAPTVIQKYGREHIGEKMYAQFGKETQVRTPQQNAALHKGLELVASALNDAGLDMRKVIKPEVDIPWTTESAKEYLWRPIQKIMTGKESTRDLDKVEEIDKIWETMIKFLGEKHGLDYMPFPSQQVINSSE